MAACGGKKSAFNFEFDDDEKLESVYARRAATTGSWKNQPKSSTGKILRVKRSSVRGIVLANEGGDGPVITSPREVSVKDMVAESFYDSVASKTGDGHSGFHLKNSLTGIVQVSFNRERMVVEPVKSITNLKARSAPTTDMEKNPSLIPGNWSKTARPRSPYISKGVFYVELESGSGYGKRAHVVPKNTRINERGGLIRGGSRKGGLHLNDIGSFLAVSTGNKDEDYVLKECVATSKVIEYMDGKWQDVWVGGKNLFGEGFQQWGVRVGNWWFVQQGTKETKIVKLAASKCKKELKLWKRVGCTTADPKWILDSFVLAYSEVKPKFHINKHNAMHMAAALVTALGIEVPFWAKEGAMARGCVKGLNFPAPRNDFMSSRAIRLF